MHKQAILDRFTFFHDAATSAQSEILDAALERKLLPASVLFREGDRCEHVAFVGWGSVRVLKTDSSGNEITLYHVQDGQPCLVNLLSIFLARPAMASAVVEVNTDAVVAERLVAVFEPRSYTSRTRVFQDDFARAFALADRVYVAAAHLPGKVPEGQRLSEADLVAAIGREGGQAVFVPTVDAIVAALAGELRPGDRVAILSNGGFGGIHR